MHETSVQASAIVQLNTSLPHWRSQQPDDHITSSFTVFLKLYGVSIISLLLRVTM
jgi:hypothetical protein